MTEALSKRSCQNIVHDNNVPLYVVSYKELIFTVAYYKFVPSCKFK